ncbi:hypothetical protein [Roseomonas fluvialis]|uniref:Uncharacterized protein n=1 Tax=Roseomonas fluvialis TaxID=1750527 RepID=A0ABM7Y5W7_9PROT|nr:hypothetical protein [Roseomonas fluvialis]BDG73296.1 hypothetical protein Rmf_32250 [Roseomonas fluvialis]
MRITYLQDGTAVPVYEPGDLVRLLRDEPGELVTAHAGEWGMVVRNRGTGGIDVRLAGHSRPRTAELPVATGLPPSMLAPCDRQGLRVDLQRDLRQARRRG